MDKVNLFRMRKLIRDTMKLQWKIEQEHARATRITTSITGMWPWTRSLWTSTTST